MNKVWKLQDIWFITEQNNCTEKEQNQIKGAIRDLRNKEQIFGNWQNLPIQGSQNKIPLLPTSVQSTTCRFCDETFDKVEDLHEHMKTKELVTIALIVCMK